MVSSLPNVALTPSWLYLQQREPFEQAQGLSMGQADTGNQVPTCKMCSMKTDKEYGNIENC